MGRRVSVANINSTALRAFSCHDPSRCQPYHSLPASETHGLLAPRAFLNLAWSARKNAFCPCACAARKRTMKGQQAKVRLAVCSRSAARSVTSLVCSGQFGMAQACKRQGHSGRQNSSELGSLWRMGFTHSNASSAVTAYPSHCKPADCLLAHSIIVEHSRATALYRGHTEPYAVRSLPRGLQRVLYSREACRRASCTEPHCSYCPMHRRAAAVRGRTTVDPFTQGCPREAIARGTRGAVFRSATVGTAGSASALAST